MNLFNQPEQPGKPSQPAPAGPFDFFAQAHLARRMYAIPCEEPCGNPACSNTWTVREGYRFEGVPGVPDQYARYRCCTACGWAQRQ